MFAEKGFHDPRLVGIEAAAEFLVQAAVGKGRGQGGKGQGGRPLHFPGDQEAAGRAVGPARLARGVQMGGIGLGQRLRRRFIEAVGIDASQGCMVIGGTGAPRHAVQNLGRPFGEIPFHQAQVQQPLARIIHDIQVQGARAGQPPQQPPGVQAQRQAQLADMARPLGPVRSGAGQGGQVAFHVEPGNGVVRLGLQPGGLEAAIGRGPQGVHPPPVHQVRDQGCDEHRLARPRQACHAQPDHRIAQADARHHCAADTHAACLFLVVFAGR